MDSAYYNGGTLQLLLLLALLIPSILFLLTQQNTLKAISPANRIMEPGMVWLQLIPLFGMVWQFFVVTRIAESLKRELTATDPDSIFSGSEQLASAKTNAPTYSIGITYCILFCCSIIPLLGGLTAVAGLICWIIYWVNLANFKKEVERKKMGY